MSIENIINGYKNNELNQDQFIRRILNVFDINRIFKTQRQDLIQLLQLIPVSEYYDILKEEIMEQEFKTFPEYSKIDILLNTLSKQILKFVLDEKYNNQIKLDNDIIGISYDVKFEIATPKEKFLERRFKTVQTSIPTIQSFNKNLKENIELDFNTTLNLTSLMINLGNFSKAFQITEEYEKNHKEITKKQKSILYNNKAYSCFLLQQYKEALNYCNEGLRLDNKNDTLIENKKAIQRKMSENKIRKENFNKPVSFKFFQGEKFIIEENSFFEFKQTKNRIEKHVRKYLTAFLNSKKGGRIFFGIEDENLIIKGIKLENTDKHNVLTHISHNLKLCVEPFIDNKLYGIYFHPIYDLNENIIQDEYVIEIYCPKYSDLDVFQDQGIAWEKIEDMVLRMPQSKLKERFILQHKKN